MTSLNQFFHRFAAGILLLACVGSFFFSGGCRVVQDEAKRTDLAAKVARGDTLRILTLYSSTSYFIYKGTEMGAEYELAIQLSEALGLPPKFIVCKNINALKEALLNGEGDLIAYNIPVTLEDKEDVIYCGRDYITHQVLVQRRERKQEPLGDVLQLKGREIYVLKDTRYHERLVNLNDEIGGGIDIRLIDQDSITTEELIERVAIGLIPYTVADNHIAELNKTYFNNIDISLPISFSQRLLWAVRGDFPELADSIDGWFRNNASLIKIKAVTKRYFEFSKRPPQRPILSLSGNKISKFDHLFKQYAATINFDWRLLASVAYQESKFDTNQVSWAGAVGLMQLMPKTAADLGLTPSESLDPEKSIDAAVRYFKSIQPLFRSVEDETERVKFLLAAYNAGASHILDAMALAKKYGKKPDVWNKEVAQCVLWKSNPEFYNDSVCKYGYLRGNETFDYVDEVLERFEMYKEIIK